MIQKLILFASVLSLTFAIADSPRAQWVRTNGTAGNSVFCFAMIGTTIFAGTQAGVILSTDNGINWRAAGLHNIYVRALAVSASYLFAGGLDSFYRSTDNGATWSAFGISGIQAIAVSGTNIFAATQSGVALSRDSGTSWTSAHVGLGYPNVTSLAVRGSNLFAGTGGSGVFLSTNNGTNWRGVGSGLSYPVVNSFAVIGTNLFAGTDGGVFLSTNNGTTWDSVNTGLTATDVQACAVSGANLFVVARIYWGYIYLSTNNGTRWTEVDDGLMRADPYVLFANNSYLFVGTYDSGVWRRPLSEMIGSGAVAEHPKTVESTVQAYPNPFSEKSEVRFTTPERGPVQVTVVNLLGVEVARLFEGELEAGEHSFTWDASRMPAGVYECIIRTAGSAQRVPMMIVR